MANVFVLLCRNKSVLTNTIGKLERRINELSDQMEEEHRIAAEQKDLVTHTHTHNYVMEKRSRLSPDF